MISNLMWAVTVASIVGTVANIYKKWWCFIIWGITNMLWVAYDLYIEAYAQAALMAVYFVTCVWGLIAWRKDSDVSRTLPWQERQEPAHV